MKINEIFYSIQGEGYWVGLPNIFIRFTGCNLRCSYCDTKYAYTKGKILSIEDIIQILNKYPCKFVCITGGEPVIQKDIGILISNLFKKGYNICLETNGSLDISEFIKVEGLIISLDIKCPSSNMHEKMLFENLLIIRGSDQVKFVIKDRVDYEYAKKILDKYKTSAAVFFQPVWGTNIKDIARWVLDDGLNVRVGFQFHKMIWGDVRGF